MTDGGARRSSGWALRQRSWIRVQSGGPATQAAIGPSVCARNLSFAERKINVQNYSILGGQNY